MAKTYRGIPNKSEQLARFMFAQAKPMTAQEVYDAGFRYDGDETSPYLVSILMNKLHHSSSYSIERRYLKKGNNRVTVVKVVSIKERPDSGAVVNESTLNLWRQLLTRHSGQSLYLREAV